MKPLYSDTMKQIMEHLRNRTPVGKSDFIRWIRNPDINVRGMVFNNLFYSGEGLQIEGGADLDDFFFEYVRYLFECLEFRLHGINTTHTHEFWDPSFGMLTKMGWLYLDCLENFCDPNKAEQLATWIEDYVRFRASSGISSEDINMVGYNFLSVVLANEQHKHRFLTWETDPDLKAIYEIGRRESS